MALTWFLPIFLVFLIYSCWGERQWTAATIVASFFQAASPLLITAGGRINGLQPAYFLLAVGFVFFVLRTLGVETHKDSPGALTLPHIFMLALTIVGVSGAFLLPVIFGGIAHVTPPRQQEAVELLRFGTGNLVQAAYMVCNFLLFIMVARCARNGSISAAQCIRALAVGTSITLGIGFYQIYCDLLHLPWPDAVFNSNTGSAQLFDQSAVGIVQKLGITRRMSSTFLEPSMLSTYLLGMFGLFALALRRWLLGAITLIALLVSTSTTAIIGVFLVIFVSMIWRAPRNNGFSLKAVTGLTLAAAAAFAVVFAVATGVFAPNFLGYITEKMQSTSGVTRATLDHIAINTFEESWGLGVGVGSTRSSSFVTTFAASTGLPGLICLLGFFGTLIVQAYRSQSAEIRALGFALATLFVGWVLSVPDMTLALVWVLSGIICGLTARQPRVSAYAVPTAGASTLELANPIRRI